ncbi:MAG TPA: dienelactone hydrolase family protein [Nitrososphaerales archaeon]|nr:dienelactone hydrolase family protein [Nitrososphaerales archaeon]
MGNLSRPQQKAELVVEPKRASACVIVFHEVWGLVEHTEDVCKRVGKLGFAAMAPNLYRGHGDILTPTNIQKAMEGLWELSLEERRDKEKAARALNKKGIRREVREVAAMIYDPAFRDRMLEDAVAAVERAYSRFGSVSTLGFCMGGGLSLRCAARSRHMKSAVSFYGQPPAVDEVLSISIPILDIHANQDEIINRAVPAWVGAMLEGGKDLTLKTYPQTKHGFFNDTRKEVYDRNAANEAWDITKWFLERTL